LTLFELCKPKNEYWKDDRTITSAGDLSFRGALEMSETQDNYYEIDDCCNQHNHASGFHLNQADLCGQDRVHTCHWQ